MTAVLTIAESARVLLDSPLGARIDIRLGEHDFDHVVLSHCAWYFDSIDRLRTTLRAVGRWAPRLCFAEWDLRPDTRTSSPPARRDELARRVGAHRRTAGLQDAGWEVDAALDLAPLFQAPGRCPRASSSPSGAERAAGAPAGMSGAPTGPR